MADTCRLQWLSMNVALSVLIYDAAMERLRELKSGRGVFDSEHEDEGASTARTTEHAAAENITPSLQPPSI